MSADCHVQKLRIRTRDKTILPRMTFTFEEAFRTASFPGIPPNGRVLIKRLDLGRFLSCVSSRLLAGRIDEALRRIRPVIIGENTKEDICAPAVWFPDDLCPHRFLINLLSKNHQPRAWYWELAIKGWRPHLTRRQSYHLILSRAAEHETGIRALAVVLEPLFENGKLLEVLAALEPREVSRILTGMGLAPFQAMKKTDRPPSGRIPPANPLPVSLRDAGIITKAAGTWSVFDPRFMLVSYLVLTRMDKKAGPVQVSRLLETVSGLSSMPGKIREPVPDPTQPTPDATLTESARTLSKVMRAQPDDTGAHPPDGRAPETTKDGMRPPRPIPWRTEPGSSDNVYAEKPVTEREPRQEKPAKPVLNEIKRAGEISQTQKTTQGDAPPMASGFPEPRPPQAAPPASRNVLKCRRSTPFREPIVTETWPHHGGFAGDISEHAGLIFIIPLMKRIGMDTLMEGFPEYEDLDLPRRIFFRCAELLSIPSDDPVLGFLGEKPKPSPIIPEFVAPPQWRRILPPPASGAYHFRLGRIIGMPGYRLILDPRGRLVVGLWHPRNRDRIKPWIDQGQKPLGLAAPRAWSMQRLVDTMVTAMNRYCRRYASMGLIGLTRRPAYVATTKTHLDVTFPFDRLDIRVRMAGLDINPGWVLWLGRVFQFHYVGGEG